LLLPNSDSAKSSNAVSFKTDGAVEVNGRDSKDMSLSELIEFFSEYFPSKSRFIERSGRLAERLDRLDVVNDEDEGE
jgi:hypothetical protein